MTGRPVRRRILCAIVAAAILPATAQADGPADYALRLPVAPAAGASLQRLTVPAQALVASRGAGLADLRLFNAAGQALPVALATAALPRAVRTVALRPLPILGDAGTLTITGVSLAIEDGRRASVVGLRGRPKAPGRAVLLGTLLDTRRIAGPLSAVTLYVDLPLGQPVTFTVEASADLAEWEPVAEKVLYRVAEATGRETIGFPPRDARGRYLRVTWAAASRLLSPVVVRGASVAESIGGGSGGRLHATLTLPPPADAHAIELTLPFATPVAAMAIVPAGAAAVVPVRILGRDDREAAWRPIAAGTAFRLPDGDSARASPPFELGGARFRSYRIEADRRTAGFAVAPRITLLFDPVRLLFLATGSPPFTLAAGRAGADDTFLPAASLVPGYGPATEAALPIATVAAGPAATIAVTGDDDAPAWRRIALWAVLLAGTALLAAMVWLLVRRQAAAKPA